MEINGFHIFSFFCFFVCACGVGDMDGAPPLCCVCTAARPSMCECGAA
jgi:hypothetical protein